MVAIHFIKNLATRIQILTQVLLTKLYIVLYSTLQIKILDLGCSGGEITLALQSRGYNIHGLDPYTYVLYKNKIIIDRVHTRIYKSEFSSSNFCGTSFTIRN